MATPARIGVELPTGEIVSIYVHWDGDPEKAGVTLQKHYRTPAKIEKLIALGDLSVLGRDIGRKHAFEGAVNAHPDWCLAYGRDRGELDQEAVVSAVVSISLKNFSKLAELSGAKFAYLNVGAPNGSRHWVCSERSRRGFGSFVPVAIAERMRSR